MDERIKVGNNCYLKAQGNEERNHKGKPFEEWIYEAKIVKVGRKYFEVKRGYWAIKYDIKTLEENTNYCSDWKFYFDRQDALDDMEHKSLEFKLRYLFTSHGFKLTLDQLRRINCIIDEN